MKQGIGFTVTINIIAIFIVVIFAFLVTTLNYYKAYKINNAISDSIEKYEGYNNLSIKDIETKLTSLGYVNDTENVRCRANDNYGTLVKTDDSKYSYCVYEGERKNGTFKYTIVTYVNFNIPIVNQVLNLPVKTKTESIYYFSD